NEDSLFNYKYLCKIDNVAVSPLLTYYYIMNSKGLVHSAQVEKKLTAYLSLNAIVLDAKDKPEILHYAHSIRCAMSCEMIYNCLKFGKEFACSISKIIEFLKEDSKHLKYCKYVALYRKVLIPLVAPISKVYFHKSLKNQKDGKVHFALEKYLTK
ncbi:MAG: hypothetical protein KBS91_03920, partial [Firmicutes bacterium]|nr:hypothetical protein [Candidatus Caballimonas caccae]